MEAVATLDEPRAARLLLHPLRRRIVDLAKQPAGASGIARALRVPRQKVNYHLHQLARVLAHLRAVKDPLRAAAAARLLPPASRVLILHLGAALDAGLAKRARAEHARSARYRWLGDVPRGRAQRVLAGSRLLVLTSRLEGGANVVSEALAAAVPVLSSRIPGSIGILGPGYPGYFAVGDTPALARLLRRAETDAAFYEGLRQCCRRLRTIVDPARERRAWRSLLRELAGPHQARL